MKNILIAIVVVGVATALLINYAMSDEGEDLLELPDGEE